MKTLRHTALLLATALGLVAVSIAPAAAGLNLGNHCEPSEPVGGAPFRHDGGRSERHHPRPV